MSAAASIDIHEQAFQFLNKTVEGLRELVPRARAGDQEVGGPIAESLLPLVNAVDGALEILQELKPSPADGMSLSPTTPSSELMARPLFTHLPRRRRDVNGTAPSSGGWPSSSPRTAVCRVEQEARRGRDGNSVQPLRGSGRAKLLKDQHE